MYEETYCCMLFCELHLRDETSFFFKFFSMQLMVLLDVFACM